MSWLRTRRENDLEARREAREGALGEGAQASGRSQGRADSEGGRWWQGSSLIAILLKSFYYLMLNYISPRCLHSSHCLDDGK